MNTENQIPRVGLITGAATGIGGALARRLAGLKWQLVLHTRANQAALEEVADEARANGSDVHLVLGDLAIPKTAQTIIGETREIYGRLDTFVSNAGFADWEPFGALDDARLEASQQAIAGGFFRLATHALPLLKDSPLGRIVAVSSFLAHVYQLGDRVAPASAMAKAGLEGLVKSLAVQLAPAKITVNCVVPGYIRKDSGTHTALSEDEREKALSGVPLGRLGLPDEVAATIAFLLSDEAAYITGQLIHVDGGLTL